MEIEDVQKELRPLAIRIQYLINERDQYRSHAERMSQILFDAGYIYNETGPEDPGPDENEFDIWCLNDLVDRLNAYKAKETQQEKSKGELCQTKETSFTSWHLCNVRNPPTFNWLPTMRGMPREGKKDFQNVHAPSPFGFRSVGVLPGVRDQDGDPF